MKFTLDYSKWRCGDNGPNALGEGFTVLKNSEGYQCCLGQFIPQVAPQITDEQLKRGTPAATGKYIPYFVEENTVWELPDNTRLSRQAMIINDAKDTTPQEKIAALKELFGKEGHEIEVINQPAMA